MQIRPKESRPHIPQRSSCSVIVSSEWHHMIVVFSILGTSVIMDRHHSSPLIAKHDARHVNRLVAKRLHGVEFNKNVSQTRGMENSTWCRNKEALHINSFKNSGILPVGRHWLYLAHRSYGSLSTFFSSNMLAVTGGQLGRARGPFLRLGRLIPYRSTSSSCTKTHYLSLFDAFDEILYFLKPSMVRSNEP